VAELAQFLALILNELATNALKHGALSTVSGRVRVSWDRDAHSGHLRLVWRESGFSSSPRPAVRGFGLTVLEVAASSIGGTAECMFGEDGFVYTLEGPFELQRTGPSADQNTALVSHAGQMTSPPMTPRRILIVEDEALVAMQLQAELEADGHRVIGPARSLKQATVLAQQADFDLALIDVRLGREISTAVADELLKRNIPFALTTGYAEGALVPEHLRAIPRLVKPYGPDSIRSIIEKLKELSGSPACV
jgi:CheY-like chemotaxis protein